MLTADLVLARTQKGQLRLIAIDERRRARALELAQAALGVVTFAIESGGATREAIDEALDELPVPSADTKLAAALRKLIEDRCAFEGPPEGVDPPKLRRALFSAATGARRAALRPEDFSPERVTAAVAEQLGLSSAALLDSLYGDLKGAERCVGWSPITAEALVDSLPIAQAQAVLLRATGVRVEVRCQSAGAYRALFRKLKFLRLLPTITPLDDGGYRLVIDGPMSLFEATTKYGLALALALPEIMSADAWSLTADVRWGKERAPLTFALEGRGVSAEVAERLPDDVQALIASFEKLDAGWSVRAAPSILALPGLGVVVPDLLFTRERDGARVWLEVLGFWSRDAVWKRVELAERGLPEPVLFATSSRLRVSEAVLDEGASGALYVYKGSMSPRAIVERLERLAVAPIARANAAKASKKPTPRAGKREVER